MKFITIEYDNDIKLHAICGTIITCNEDGSNIKCDCLNLNAETLDSIDGIYIPKHGAAKSITK